MIRATAGLLALFAVGYPLGLMPTAATGLLSLLAGTFCAAGIIGSFPSLVALGAGVAMLEYALALLPASGSLDLVGALAFGVALSLLVQMVNFEARFRGAVVESQVVREHVRSWMETGAAAVILGVILAVVGDGLMIGLPPTAYPALAALGAVLVFGGLVGGMIRGAGPPGFGRGEDGQ
jgi:hypothetical protein